MTAVVVEDQSTDGIIPLPIMERSQPSQTVNLILMMREHGVHAIAELEDEIARLDERRAELERRRDTIQRMFDVAIAHESPSKVINA